MSEWWTYRPSDFLLFSARAYYRLFELHNAATWPLHLLTIAAGLIMLVIALRRSRYRRWTIVALAPLWVVVAIAFLWRRYAPINWTATYAAVAFLAQALLLVLVMARSGDRQAAPGRRRVGALLAVAGVIAYPVIAPLAGRGVSTAEVFGIAPDPTAIATLGIVMLGASKGAWLGLVIPVLWCMTSAITLHTMESGEWVVPAAAALLAAVTSLITRHG